MKKNLLTIGLLVFCFMTYAQLDTEYFNKLKTERVVSSDTIQWRQIGPGMSGYCEEFWCHPTNENVMFMSPDMYNSYGSWDNGKSWQTIKDEDGSGKDMRRIQSITFSHQDQNLGYAIDVRGHLYKSTDQGRNWERQSFPGSGKYAELVVDPSDDNNWYVGAGDFWNVKFNHRSLNNKEGYVYKYAAYGHLFKSTDKGKTWSKKSNGLPSGTDFGRIIVDPTNSKNIIIATNKGVFKSVDQGDTWALSSKGLPNNLPRDMTYYYNESSKEFILYVLEQTFFEPSGNTITSKGGVYKSIDHGTTWVSVTGDLGVDFQKITNYSARDKYYKSIAFWLGLSITEAKSKYPVLPTNICSVFNRISVNPNNKDEIYLSQNVKHDKAFVPGDVWKTSDGGTTWFPTARTGNYWKTESDKAYWKSRKSPLGMNTSFAHLQHEMDVRDEVYGNRFLVLNKKGEAFICLDQQVLRSIDGGESWKQIDDDETKEGSHHWVGRGDSNLPGRFMLLETGIEKRYLFCSGEHGLWQSAPLDGYDDKMAIPMKQIEGQNNVNGATSIASVAVDPKNPNTIYILMFRQDHRGQFRRSTDGGKTWENVSKPLQYGGNLSQDHIFQYSLTVDYENTQNIYFCVMGNPIAEVSGQRLPSDFKDLGVYRSIDGGKTWSTENTGMPADVSVRRIKMDPDNPSTLYAALNEGKNGVVGGLYKTIDKGANWSQITIPSAIKSVNNVFIDRNTKHLYISCGRETGTFAEGGVWRSRDQGLTWEKIFDMPYIWQTEISPVNSDIITVLAALPHENRGATIFNPGAYISKDGGKTWMKVNKNIGQPDTITDFKPDPKNQGIFWLALKGSGWAVGYIKGMTDGWAIEEEHVNNGGNGTGGEGNNPPLNINEGLGFMGLKLSPNPTIDNIQLTFKEILTQEVVVNIYDLSGVSVLGQERVERNGLDNSVSIVTTSLEAGTYIISVQHGQQKYVQKFVKK